MLSIDSSTCRVKEAIQRVAVCVLYATVTIR